MQNGILRSLAPLKMCSNVHLAPYLFSPRPVPALFRVLPTNTQNTLRTPLTMVALCLFLISLSVPTRLHANEEMGISAWEKENITDVAEKIKERAKQGNVRMQNQLGNMYYHGDGVSKDLEQAVYWYRQAATKGYAPGQFNLARLYRQGKGVEQDYSQAVYWYRKAAEQDLAIAQFFLGKSYAEGRGIEQDLISAYRWLNKAAIQGDIDAQCTKDRLAKSMRPEELALAKLSDAQFAKARLLDQTKEESPKKKEVATSSPKENTTARTNTGDTLLTAAPPSKEESDKSLSKSAETNEQDFIPEVSTQTKAKPPLKQPKPSQIPKSLSKDEVLALQRRLHTLGFDSGPIDGLIGSKTLAAVRAFQKSIKLEPDGKVPQELLE